MSNLVCPTNKSLLSMGVIRSFLTRVKDPVLTCQDQHGHRIVRPTDEDLLQIFDTDEVAAYSPVSMLPQSVGMSRGFVNASST